MEVAIFLQKVEMAVLVVQENFLQQHTAAAAVEEAAELEELYYLSMEKKYFQQLDQ